MNNPLEKYLFNCKAFTVEVPAWVGAGPVPASTQVCCYVPLWAVWLLKV